MSTFGRWRDASRALVFGPDLDTATIFQFGSLFDTISMKSVPTDPVAPKTTIFLLLLLLLLLLYAMCCSLLVLCFLFFCALLLLWIL